MGEIRLAKAHGRWGWAVGTIFVLGVLIQAFLSLRSWIGGDQFVLLGLGLDLVETGQLQPVAKSMSGGAFIPGCLLQVLMGVPLLLWADYRAPVLLIGLLHIAAGLLLARTLYRAVGGRFVVIYLLVYWLSPWRLFHAGFSWEPAFMFLPAATHLWACWKLRNHPAGFPSAVLAGTMVLGMQLHGSFLLLVVFTAVLYVRKLIRLHWWTGLLGALLGAIPLLPSLQAVLKGTMPAVVPSEGYPGFGLVAVYPVLRGLGYWFRLGSLDIGGRLKDVVFLEDAWVAGHPTGQLIEGGVLLLFILTVASTILCVVAAWWLLRRGRNPSGRSEGWVWLRSYALSGLVAVLIASALSPVVIQGWHVLVALPAAALPVTAWLAEHWPPKRTYLRWVIVLFLALRIPEILVLGLGHHIYRPVTPSAEGTGTIPERLLEILPSDSARPRQP